MFEKALTGTRKYWVWIFFLLAVCAAGSLCYLQQLRDGLGITGLSRDVSWGFYIAQFTFLVGVAASAVMVVLPYYLHNYKAFGRITILGEFLAVSSVAMCLMFIIADLGQPQRALNMVFHPTPSSILFWDMIVLNGYLLLNIVIGWNVLSAEKKGIAPPRWIKPVIYLSIPWAISIHTVTAFIYNGLSAKPFWLTAILAPRFLASAFASGPALLIILCLVVRKFTKFDPGKDAIQKLAVILTYGMIINVFFILLEFFTVYYSDMPHHLHHFDYLYFGHGGEGKLLPWMWTSSGLAVLAILLLLSSKVRAKEGVLALICVMVFASIWIDKGMGMVVTGFVPNAVGAYTEYMPTGPEIAITLGVYAVGFLILTILYKIGVSVKEETAG